VILAVAGLAAALIVAYTKSETFRNIVKGAFDVVRGAIDAVLRVGGLVAQFFAQNWDLILAPLTGGLSVLFQHFDQVRGIISAVVDWLKKLPGFIDKALGPLDELLGTVASIAGKVAGAAGGVLGKLKLPHFDRGGTVPGPLGSPELIVAHGGETVVPTHRLTNWRGELPRFLIAS
jgi:phage-related protein